MTIAEKPRAPEQQMGVYTELSDVPDRYRFHQHSQAYAGRDVWGEFVTEQREKHGVSKWYCDVARKAGRHWKDHMESQGRHHALATPDDVEQWCVTLLDTRKVTTVYREYWVRLEQFYTWLQHHTEHPHVYHPVLMAAAEYPKNAEIWDHKLSQRRGESA